MDEELQKEQFSNAYLRAIAAAAGYNLNKPEIDDDSVDWQIGMRGGGGSVRSPKIELQLKCSGRDILHETHLAYPLKIKNYDDLRFDDFLVPRILVVMSVPTDVVQWLDQTEDLLTLRHCTYWTTLRGMPPTPNTATVTVHIPRAQVLSVDGLKAMMGRVATGGLP